MESQTSTPLADRMRPRTLDEFVGQTDIIGPGRILREAIEGEGEIPSMIFWGPPGSGKTTLAGIIAERVKARFMPVSAVTTGVKEIRAIIAEAKETRRYGQQTVLFIDEIHRFNKAQQDAFLPHVESGVIRLIGATTENPSFSVNAALLSRCRVFVLQALSVEHIVDILQHALVDSDRGLGKKKVKMSEAAIRFLSTMSNGDARVALNALELAALAKRPGKDGAVVIEEDALKEALQRTHLLYDKEGEEHYNIISALHKSMRGGDANAALYWLGRMLEAGEDPLYVARRIIRFASEDIGLANSFALPQAVAAYQACHSIGMPECGLNLAQAVVYMAKSKKSNALYTAYTAVQDDIKNLPAEPVPLHLRNAPTDLMKNLGYGKGYKYTPEFNDTASAEQDYLPERLQGKKYLPE